MDSKQETPAFPEPGSSRPGFNKVDNFERDRRIRIVYEWICENQTRADIIKSGVNKWGVSERQMHRLLYAAHLEFKRLSQPEAMVKKGQHIEMRMKLFREMEAKKTVAGTRAALQILDSIAKLEGLVTDDVHLSTVEQPLFPEVKKPSA